MTKKITAFLTAMLCAVSMAAMPASATDLSWFDNDLAYFSGWLHRVEEYPLNGILVETDGSELSEEMLSSFKGYSGITDFESFTADYPWGVTLVDASPDNTAYIIFTGAMTADELTAFGRTVMQEVYCIENAQLVNCTFYQKAHLNHGFYIALTTSDNVLDETTVPEFAGFKLSRYDDTTYYCEIPDAAKEDIIAQNNTTLELYEFYMELADTVMENHSDIISNVVIDFDCLDDAGETEASASSVWQSAGDSNTDGEVNAADAAEMLVSAAQIGTGVDVAVTSAADVNADGLLNAEDAAAVLSYAAAKGTGADVSWVDILRR